MSLLVRALITFVFLAAFAVFWHYATSNVYIEGLDIDYVWLAKLGLWLAPFGAVVTAIGILCRHPLTMLAGFMASMMGGSFVWLFETTLRPVYMAQREVEQVQEQNRLYLAGAIQSIPCPLNWQLLLVVDTRFRSETQTTLVLLPSRLSEPALELAKADFRGQLQELPYHLSANARTIRDGCKDETTGATYKSLLQKY